MSMRPAVFKSLLITLTTSGLLALMAPHALAQQDTASLGPAQEPLYNAARDAYQRGEHDKALEILDGLLRLGDLDVAYLEVARNQVALLQCDAAAAALEKANAAGRSGALDQAAFEDAVGAIKGDIAVRCEGQATAQQLYELGVGFFERREWDKAAQAFEKAFELEPNPTLGYNAGRSYEYAGDLDAAMRFYRAALDLGPEGKAKDKIERTIERLENLSKQMGEARSDVGLIDIVTEPPGAIVRFDGVAVGETPFRQAQAPGKYEVTVTLPGYAEASRTIELEAGQEKLLDITLEDEGYLWTWITLGSSVALAGTGVTFGVLAQNKLDEANEAEVKRSDDFESIKDQGQLFSNLSLTFYGLAGAGLITAAVVYLYESPEENNPGAIPQQDANLRLIVAPDFVGIGGQF